MAFEGKMNAGLILSYYTAKLIENQSFSIKTVPSSLLKDSQSSINASAISCRENAYHLVGNSVYLWSLLCFFSMKKDLIFSILFDAALLCVCDQVEFALASTPGCLNENKVPVCGTFVRSFPSINSLLLALHDTTLTVL
jgi:hypothetical protein